jgi:hypothetical protein
MVTNSWDFEYLDGVCLYIFFRFAQIITYCPFIVMISYNSSKQRHTLHWHDSSVGTNEGSYVKCNVIALLKVGQSLFYFHVEIS